MSRFLAACAGVAQLVEQRIRNAKVGSSTLFTGTTVRFESKNGFRSYLEAVFIHPSSKCRQIAPRCTNNGKTGDTVSDAEQIAGRS